jgi:RimJ/RimL family protein N-acetyltransferase
MIPLSRIEWSGAGMPDSEITVRRLLPADSCIYRDIRLEALLTSPEAFSSAYEAESAEPLEWFASRLQRAAVFGAFERSDLLGVAGFFNQQGRKEAHKGGLWGMYVRSRARNTGIGKRLAAAVIDCASQRVELIQLSMVSGNEPARRLYAGLGFVEYGIEKNALKHNGRYWDEVLMAKPLMTDVRTDHDPAL